MLLTVFIKLFFITVCLVLLLVFTFVVVCQVLMVRNRKSDINLFDRRILFNPFNIQFFGEKYLTGKGIHWRNKSWLCLGIFVITIMIILSLKLFFTEYY